MNVFMVAEIATRVRDAVQETMRRISTDAGAGVYLCVASGNGVPLFTFGIGTFPTSELERAVANHFRCTRNAIRLGQHPTHLTSFERSDPERERSRGAVRFGETILSLRGFASEFTDEAVVLLAACRPFERHKFHGRDGKELTIHEFVHLVATENENTRWFDLASAIHRV